MNINSKSKITLTIKQLKDLISESSMKVAEDIPSKKPFRAQDLYKYGFTHDKKMTSLMMEITSLFIGFQALTWEYLIFVMAVQFI